MPDRRQGIKTHLAQAVIAATILLVAYLLAYFLVRGYSLAGNVTAIFYGDNCMHLYGPREDRFKLIYDLHALQRESAFGFLSGVYEDEDVNKYRWSLLFVPAELLEDSVRGLSR